MSFKRPFAVAHRDHWNLEKSWLMAERDELWISVTRDEFPDTDALLPLLYADQGQRCLRCLSLPVSSMVLDID